MRQELSLYEMLLGLPNLVVERVVFENNELHIFCYIGENTAHICPSCQCTVCKKTPKYRREIRDLSISGRKVILQLLVHQYLCDCGRTSSEVFDFVDSGKSYTKRLGKYIFELSAQQSHTRVAALVDMSHKTVERICKHMAAPQADSAKWAGVERLGIDEFAFKKGHKDYITTLVDLDTHELIDIIDSRKKDTLKAYFQGLGSDICNNIKEFCSDMWGPFQDLGKDCFPSALIHVDRFHWTQHLHKIVDKMRKELRRTHKKEEAFKGLKWALIKRPEQLNQKEQQNLKAAFAKSVELEELYELRNTFQAIFDADYSYEFAVQQVEHWLSHARSLCNQYVDEFIALFERHRENILNYFKTRLSTGAVEGNNNVLRTVKRFTFNMTNFENFKARVFAYKR